MQITKRCVAPMEVNLDPLKGSYSFDKHYRESIGSSLYLLVDTRPETAFLVGRMAKFVERPIMIH